MESLVQLTEPQGDELVQRLQPVLYRRAVLDDADVHFASDLVERPVSSGPGTALDVGQWARLERILCGPGDPAEADVPVESLS
jgi:hypothetical protein